MKSILLISVSLFVAVLFSGCPSTKIEYNSGIFPSEPVNFTEVNSAYDDYNIALPIIQHNQYLCFSSNRNSAGENFDIVGDNLNVWWDMETGLLTINDNMVSYDISFVDTLQQMINTPANEFGPFSLNCFISSGANTIPGYHLIAYSSNYESDDYKSKFVYYESDGHENGDGNYYGPYNINLINSLQNAQYISFFHKETCIEDYCIKEPNEYDKMFFNSDLNGNTDIFSIDLPPNDNFIDMLKSDTAIVPIFITELNSEAEDKCPFVNNHLMVFSSNREGGYGGYDLYYSRFENGLWSSPVNFGEDINSSFNEFRPVTITVYDFVNDLMIFSSDRPGGKGGFDLYYVGMPFKVYDLVSIIN
jgi:hypothetical protein